MDKFLWIWSLWTPPPSPGDGTPLHPGGIEGCTPLLSVTLPMYAYKKKNLIISKQDILVDRPTSSGCTHPPAIRDPAHVAHFTSKSAWNHENLASGSANFGNPCLCSTVMKFGLWSAWNMRSRYKIVQIRITKILSPKIVKNVNFDISIGQKNTILAIFGRKNFKFFGE